MISRERVFIQKTNDRFNERIFDRMLAGTIFIGAVLWYLLGW